MTDYLNKTKEELISYIDQLNEEINFFKKEPNVSALYDKILINPKDYLSLLETESDAIFKGDESLNIMYVNKSAAELTGFNEEELCEKKVSDLFSKEELKKQPLMVEAVFDGKFIIKRRNIIQKDGSSISIEMNTKRLSDGTFFCIMKDISHRVKLEYALTESESRYKLAIDAAEEGVWDWDTNSDLVFYSDQWKAQLGYLPNEIENLFSSWETLLHPDDKQRMLTEVENYLNKPVEHFMAEFRLRHKDGSYRWIKNKAASVLSDKGEVIRMFGAHTDITEEVQMKQELIESEKKYRSLFETLPYGGEVLDTKGNILDVSPGTTKLLGYTKEDLIGKHVSHIIHKNDIEVFNEKFPNVLKGVKEAAEIRMLKKDGSEIAVIRAAQPIRNQQGKIYSVFTLSIDISKRKEIEKTLLEKNKIFEQQNKEYLLLNEELAIAKEKAEESNRLKTSFLANMSHEIRTPLNGILGFSQLLMIPGISDEKVSDYTKIIMQSGNHLLKIINDIIDIAKIDAGQFQIYKSPVELNLTLKEIYSFFHSYKTGKGKEKIDLRLHMEFPDDSVILTDETRLRQILSNLLNNAFKFIEKGFIEFGYKIHGEELLFFVKDTGIGIKKEKLSVIFSRFMQASLDTEKLYGGTGLGLSISKACTELLGGKIWVESEPAKGSTFYFTIPNKKAVLSDEINNDIHEPIFSGQKILIVEDDYVNYEYINEILNELNLNLNHVETADDALDLVRKQDFDMILMDIQLPGNDGNYAIKEIRKLKPNVPVIAQSAYAFENEKLKSYEAGCDIYLTKPIKQEDLIEAIGQFFNSTN